MSVLNISIYIIFPFLVFIGFYLGQNNSINVRQQ